MATTKKTYNVNNIKQLVDLNGASTNFDLTFKCTSKDGSPFDALVVDQKTLDNNKNFEYKNAKNGSLSGNIVSDKNIYQNYFLVLKSDKPCQVDVEIEKKDIQPSTQIKDLGTNYVPPDEHPPKLPLKSRNGGGNGKKVNWKLILLLVVIIGGGIALYFIWTKDKKSKESVTVGFRPKGSSISSRANILGFRRGGNVPMYKAPELPSKPQLKSPVSPSPSQSSVSSGHSSPARSITPVSSGVRRGSGKSTLLNRLSNFNF